MFRVDDAVVVSRIGETPLLKLPSEGCATILIKLEGNNPGGSVKDRAAWGMLRYAEAEGKLSAETVLVEPTSGNTGIALAMLGRALGLRVILTMPESMSLERRAILEALGADLVLTPVAKGMEGAVRRAQELLQEISGGVLLDQFSNPGNPWAHQVTTGPEILTALRGAHLRAFVAGVGTGGTLSGVGRTLKAAYPQARIIAVEPSESPVLSGGVSGPHQIQGIGAGFVPRNFHRDVVDEILSVSTEEAFETTRWLVERFGFFCGVSTGANVTAARRIARLFPPEDVVVTLSPDRGDKYLSLGVFRGASP
jgi:cysteine synthase A